MAQNKKLLDVVASEMALLMKDEPDINFIMEGDEEGTKNLILSMGALNLDKPYKIVFMFKKKIGYGYDFSVKTDDTDDRTSQEIYENAVNSTKKITESRIKNVEQFVSSGIKEDRFGWYITELP